MKKCLFVVLGSGFLVCGGCASMVKKVDVNKGLDSYYSQPRTVDLVTIKGSNMTITATGVNEMKVSSILPPLNAIPREPGVLEKAIGGVADVAKFGLGFYYGGLSHFFSLFFMSIRPSVCPDRFFFRAQ